jgi:hypothetical protein
MIAKQVPSRQDGSSDFGALAKYITGGITSEQLATMAVTLPGFGQLTQYVAQNQGNAGQQKCVAVCLNRLLSVGSAPAQFYSTVQKHQHAARNPVENPVVHLVVSWPEHERPSHEAVFDAARDVLKALNLHEHQWLMAIHNDTDNLHCHIEVSRIHPDTYRSQHLPWMHRTLHRAAREIEIRNGWSHDNGLFVVREMPDGRQFVVPNDSYRETADVRHEPYVEKLARMAAWSDERSLTDLCRNVVSKDLVNAIVSGKDWAAVHEVLEQHGMRIDRTGDAAFRLQAMTPAGEIVRLPVSRALRSVRLGEAEAILGAFVAHPRPLRPARASVTAGESTGATQAAGRGSQTRRDPLKRETARLERAAARTALIDRFRAEQQGIRAGRATVQHALRTINNEKRAQLADLKARLGKRKQDAVKSGAGSVQRAALTSLLAFERLSGAAQINAVAEAKKVEVLSTRPPSVSWRAWLERQAQAGDRAALGALRGLVYQEGRDAKKAAAVNGEDVDPPDDDPDKVLATLLAREHDEDAIRSARPDRIRAYQADVLLRDIHGMKWRVTNNGNVEYQRASGDTVFVDRGHKLTFDRQVVTDQDLTLTLLHAREKWRSGIVLTGGDWAFTERMVKAAVEAGITVKNPELQSMQAMFAQQRQPTHSAIEAKPAGQIPARTMQKGKRRR